MADDQSNSNNPRRDPRAQDISNLVRNKARLGLYGGNELRFPNRNVMEDSQSELQSQMLKLLEESAQRSRGSDQTDFTPLQDVADALKEALREAKGTPMYQSIAQDLDYAQSMGKMSQVFDEFHGLGESAEDLRSSFDVITQVSAKYATSLSGAATELAEQAKKRYIQPSVARETIERKAHLAKAMELLDKEEYGEFDRYARRNRLNPELDEAGYFESDARRRRDEWRRRETARYVEPMTDTAIQGARKLAGGAAAAGGNEVAMIGARAVGNAIDRYFQVHSAVTSGGGGFGAGAATGVAASGLIPALKSAAAALLIAVKSPVVLGVAGLAALGVGGLIGANYLLNRIIGDAEGESDVSATQRAAERFADDEGYIEAPDGTRIRANDTDALNEAVRRHHSSPFMTHIGENDLTGDFLNFLEEDLSNVDVNIEDFVEDLDEAIGMLTDQIVLGNIGPDRIKEFGWNQRGGLGQLSNDLSDALRASTAPSALTHLEGEWVPETQRSDVLEGLTNAAQLGEEFLAFNKRLEETEGALGGLAIAALAGASAVTFGAGVALLQGKGPLAAIAAGGLATTAAGAEFMFTAASEGIQEGTKTGMEFLSLAQAMPGEYFSERFGSVIGEGGLTDNILRDERMSQLTAMGFTGQEIAAGYAGAFRAPTQGVDIDNFTLASGAMARQFGVGLDDAMTSLQNVFRAGGQMSVGAYTGVAREVTGGEDDSDFTRSMADAFIQAARTINITSGAGVGFNNVLGSLGVIQQSMRDSGNADLAALVKVSPEMATQTLSGLGNFARSALGGNQLAMSLMMRSGMSIYDMSLGTMTSDQMDSFIGQLVSSTGLNQFISDEGEVMGGGRNIAALMANQMGISTEGMLALIKQWAQPGGMVASGLTMEEILGREGLPEGAEGAFVRDTNLQELLQIQTASQMGLVSALDESISSVMNFQSALAYMTIAGVGFADEILGRINNIIGLDDIDWAAGLLGTSGFDPAAVYAAGDFLFDENRDLTPGGRVVARMTQSSGFFGSVGPVPLDQGEQALMDAFIEGSYMDFDELMERLIIRESSGEHLDSEGNLTRSNAGALGITQIMPATALSPGFGVSSLVSDPAVRARLHTLYNEATNGGLSREERNATMDVFNQEMEEYLATVPQEDFVRFGEEYLRGLLSHYGDVTPALAAYNWGAGNVDKAMYEYGDDWLSNAPAETRNYVQAILDGRTLRGGDLDESTYETEQLNEGRVGYENSTSGYPNYNKLWPNTMNLPTPQTFELDAYTTENASPYGPATLSETMKERYLERQQELIRRAVYEGVTESFNEYLPDLIDEERDDESATSRGNTRTARRTGSVTSSTQAEILPDGTRLFLDINVRSESGAVPDAEQRT